MRESIERVSEATSHESDPEMLLDLTRARRGVSL